MKQRGRVSIAELAENSNKLIALNTSWKPRLMSVGGIWNLTGLNPDFFKINFNMVQFSEGWGLVPTIWKPCHMKSGCFCLAFQIVFDNMAAICLDFKWSGFRISDPVKFWTIWEPTVCWPFKNQKASRFQIPTVFILYFIIKSNLWRNISIIRIIFFNILRLRRGSKK